MCKSHEYRFVAAFLLDLSVHIKNKTISPEYMCSFTKKIGFIYSILFHISKKYIILKNHDCIYIKQSPHKTIICYNNKTTWLGNKRNVCLLLLQSSTCNMIVLRCPRSCPRISKRVSFHTTPSDPLFPHPHLFPLLSSLTNNCGTVFKFFCLTM